MGETGWQRVIKAELRAQDAQREAAPVLAKCEICGLEFKDVPMVRAGYEAALRKGLPIICKGCHNLALEIGLTELRRRRGDEGDSGH